MGRFVMRATLACVVLALTTVACTSGPAPDVPGGGAPTPVHPAQVVELRLGAVPEGPPGPVFKRGASADHEIVWPLARVERYIPNPLPAPSDRQGDCPMGGDVVITLASGSKLTYGPCTVPTSINTLWAAMLFVATNGQCAPDRCGPTTPPQLRHSTPT